MKINRLDAHDRYEYVLKDQDDTIYQGAEDCLKKNPLSLKYQEKSPYIYIFAHPRSTDDGLNKRLLWQPRFIKPKAQTNSYLFRAQSNTDLIEICWLLPPEELWKQYEEGKVCESNWVQWSIRQYKYNRTELEKSLQGDISEERAWKLFKEVLHESKEPMLKI